MSQGDGSSLTRAVGSYVSHKGVNVYSVGMINEYSISHVIHIV